MRYLVAINFFYLLVLVTTSVCRDNTSASSSSPSLVFLGGRRALEKWSISFKSQQGDHNLKGFSFDSIEQAAGSGVKSTNQENSKAYSYSTETQNSSNMDLEEIVYHIDYHGATTHPTPTPKHPRP